MHFVCVCVYIYIYICTKRVEKRLDGNCTNMQQVILNKS